MYLQQSCVLYLFKAFECIVFRVPSLKNSFFLNEPIHFAKNGVKLHSCVNIFRVILASVSCVEWRGLETE